MCGGGRRGRVKRYDREHINYIVLDQTVSDPATMISGDVNGKLIQRIRSRHIFTLFLLFPWP